MQDEAKKSGAAITYGTAQKYEDVTVSGQVKVFARFNDL